MAIDSERGLFLPTTDAYDRSIIGDIDINSPEFKDFLVSLYQTTGKISRVVNLKDSGIYKQEEFINGQTWFQDSSLDSTTTQTPKMRQVYRKVFDLGQLRNSAGTDNYPHGIDITARYSFTRIYGTASDTAGFSYLPIPYVSATTANIIELNVDATNINITVGKDQSAFDTCYVILEYIAE